ncbi:MAG: glycoside hydrolase family 97 N-terminal domain-containing protein, partial [Candidatus Marinimicrobia bacterium]|nr:glycoside hydrolase family 97 N-terminal domain-containing protein [Candidatus Neomarinimicrobiota bacterium]
MRKSVIIFIVCLVVMGFSTCSLLKPMKPAIVDSPDGKITVEVIIKEGIPYYQVSYGQEMIIDLSKLGFEFKNADPMNANFKVTTKIFSVVDEKWKPVYGT